MNGLYASRIELQECEKQHLASYAMLSQSSLGRKYEEEEHEYRTAFQRDRDRVIHSRAFRRLEYKTQVFVNHEGDHYRTRLTHTMEVAQIARNLSRALRLNEDLAEVLALVHDVGHPPFGHSGEKGLNEVMKNCGGFEHNTQSLRIVERLEKRYPQFDGLNLTLEVIDGMKKHTAYDGQLAVSLEGLLVNICDELAYNCHDLDDGLSSGLLTLDQVNHLPIWKEMYQKTQQAFAHISDEVAIAYTIRNLINCLVTDVVLASSKKLKDVQGLSIFDLRKNWQTWIGFNPELKTISKEIKKFLFENLYKHPQVERMNREAITVVQSLFKMFIEKPDLLPENTRKKFAEYDKEHVICDYIAGMTDRFALNMYGGQHPSLEKGLA